jgi:hypothetical protein
MQEVFRDENMITYSEMKRMREEVAVACFKLLCRHSPRTVMRNYVRSHSIPGTPEFETDTSKLQARRVAVERMCSLYLCVRNI